MFTAADYELRPLTAQDEPLLWEMLYQALSPPGVEAPAREIIRRPEYARFVEGWGRPTDCGYVAHDKNEGTLLGAVWLRTPVEIQAGDAPPELAFAVKEGHRQRGIGASLLTQLVRANPGLSAVLLHVGAKSSAVRLFEKFGFEIASPEARSVVMRRAI
ncbi:MAG: GNAT family N-acetyltransferase [Verrucomicrobiota bacterium]|nr:GNAT family N-acetyltransferase [Verrucomicrobiota bacterium]